LNICVGKISIINRIPRRMAVYESAQPGQLPVSCGIRQIEGNFFQGTA